MGNLLEGRDGPVASGHNGKVGAAIASIVSLLSSRDPMSGRAIKSALTLGHPRAVLEAALAHGTQAGHFLAVAGARNARLYRNAATVPSVPSAVSQVSEPAVSPPSGTCTRRELAQRMGVVMQTVTKWEQDGLPIAERGRKGKPSLYRETECRAWISARDEAAQSGGLFDVSQERARRERAQAVLAEQMFQMRSQDLLPRVEVERVWEGEVVAVRAKLLQIPSTFADRVYQAALSEGVMGVERILVEAVNDVLRELAGDQAPEAGAA